MIYWSQTFEVYMHTLTKKSGPFTFPETLVTERRQKCQQLRTLYKLTSTKFHIPNDLLKPKVWGIYAHAYKEVRAIYVSWNAGNYKI
jgi:hypothetical protein